MGQRPEQPLIHNTGKAGWAWGAGIAAMVFVAYLPFKQPDLMNNQDSFWYVPTAMSVMSEGDFELSEFRDHVTELLPNRKSLIYAHLDKDKRIDRIRSHPDPNHFALTTYHNRYNPATALVSIPFVAAGNIYLRKIDNPIERSIRMAPWIAKAWAAMTVGLLFVVLGYLGAKPVPGLICTALFAFATTQLSSHAGGLWSHNTAAFFLLLGLLPVFIREGKFLWTAAIPLALAFTMRGALITALGIFTVFVLLKHRRQILPYALAGAVCAALFFAYYLSIYGKPFHATHPAKMTVELASLGRLAGLLLSPNRGLLIYSPFLALSVAGAVMIWRRRGDFHPLLPFIVLMIPAHLLFLCNWPLWWGGWSYGPRLCGAVLPLWIIALFPVFNRLHDAGRAAALRWVAVGLLGGAGALIHLRGASSPAGHAWNSDPSDVDKHPERLWDWSDIQFLRR